MRHNWIQKCFDSIINSTIPVNIIAVDNGSSDGSIEYVKEKYPQVDFVISKENLGFGKANNIGMKKALDNGGDYFFLLNQDAWVDPQTIEELVKQAKNNPQYGIVSPMHLNGKGDALDFSFSTYLKPEKCENIYSDFVLNRVSDHIYESEFICAASWLISKECLKIVGGFSPVFYHYGEDDNFVNRLIYKKMKIGVYPKVFIYHDRETREGGMLKDRSFNLKKNILLQYSDPNKKIDIKREISILKLKIFFSRLSFRNKNIIKDMILVKNILSESEKTIEKNLKISKSDADYIFL